MKNIKPMLRQTTTQAVKNLFKKTYLNTLKYKFEVSFLKFHLKYHLKSSIKKCTHIILPYYPAMKLFLQYHYTIPLSGSSGHWRSSGLCCGPVGGSWDQHPRGLCLHARHQAQSGPWSSQIQIQILSALFKIITIIQIKLQ